VNYSNNTFLCKRFILILVRVAKSAVLGFPLSCRTQTEGVIFIQEITQTTCHPCTDITPDLTEDDDYAAGHVFATVIACAFDYCCSAGVADGEAFAGASVGEEVAACGSVEAGVADDYIAAGVEDRACVRFDHDFAAVNAFADVIVAFAGED
jgi:hypothetical protein